MPYIDVSNFTKQDDNNCALNDIYNVTSKTGPLGRFIVWMCKNPEAYTWTTLKFGESVRWVERKSSDLLLFLLRYIIIMIIIITIVIIIIINNKTTHNIDAD
jgi:hypothetical protein